MVNFCFPRLDLETLYPIFSFGLKPNAEQSISQRIPKDGGSRRQNPTVASLVSHGNQIIIRDFPPIVTVISARPNVTRYKSLQCQPLYSG